MATLVSPGVLVQEFDLSNYVAPAGGNNGAIVGSFVWGPVDDIVLINSEQDLVSSFGKPKRGDSVDYLCAAAFLAYSGGLNVVRAVGVDALNASGGLTSAGSGLLVKNGGDYSALALSSQTDVFAARFPGDIGNSLKIAYCDADGFATWAYRSLFSSAPESDSLGSNFHIVVVDSDGSFSGDIGGVLEAFDDVVVTDEAAKRFDGTSAYIVNRLRDNSRYIYALNTATLVSGSTDGFLLGGGVDGTLTDGDRQSAWTLFQSDDVDVRHLIVGNASTTVAKWVIDNIAEYRMDCVAFVSPQLSDVVGVDVSTAVENMKTTRTTFGNSSYFVMDSNYKYAYDRFNDTYTWIPLNGDIAGLNARTADEAEAWFSPAGLNRGRIKGVVKFAMQQNQTVRDELYQSQINPVLVFSGEGAVLFGDKTGQTKPSAFDRLNVRNLFIFVEKSIAAASKYMLFEQNDAFTRRQFFSMVEPFLRDVQGRRGIIDFKVVCDDTNNTAEVIDRNEFICDFYIKPTKSINFIKLRFAATRTGVSFEEVLL